MQQERKAILEGEMETEFMTEKEILPYPFGSPRDILTALFRHKIKILIVFIAIFPGRGILDLFSAHSL